MHRCGSVYVCICVCKYVCMHVFWWSVCLISTDQKNSTALNITCRVYYLKNRTRIYQGPMREICQAIFTANTKQEEKNPVLLNDHYVPLGHIIEEKVQCGAELGMLTWYLLPWNRQVLLSMVGWLVVCQRPFPQASIISLCPPISNIHMLVMSLCGIRERGSKVEHVALFGGW